MSDDKGEKITEPTEVVETAATDPKTDAQTSPQAEQGDKLSNLMAGEGQAATGKAPAKPAPDLDAEALQAAEQALVEGERALAAARDQMRSDSSPPDAAKAAPKRGRELALRLLLAVNVVAMVVVALLPEPVGNRQPTKSGPESAVNPGASAAAVPTRFNEPWNRAMDAADRRNFASAVSILEGYLRDAPRMAPSQKLSVFMALSHYAARDNDFKKSQDYQRRAEAIDQSHSLPEDLVAMAQAAAASGDHETLRRVWARFLLQQRQIPSWLYKHVAEAYLQLGDSYRNDANIGAEQARLKELEDAAARLRDESATRQEKPR